MDYDSGHDDAPETPAPLFALKAFRHAIFGTPSADDNATRPKQTRASTLPVRTTRRSMDAASSPAKGILVTPGTGTSRRKTVTFGASQGRDERIASTATPQVPGHFPTAASGRSEQKSKWRVNPRPATSTANAGLFEQRSRWRTNAGPQPLKSQVDYTAGRDPATQRQELRFEGSVHSAANRTQDENETTDMSAPRSASGKYWKSEFDSFSSKSTNEVKKLADKAKRAKAFARLKDDEALRLEDELACERRKVANLEKKLAEYETRLSESVKSYRKERPEENLADVFPAITAAATTTSGPLEHRRSLEKPTENRRQASAQTQSPKRAAVAGSSKRSMPLADTTNSRERRSTAKPAEAKTEPQSSKGSAEAKQPRDMEAELQSSDMWMDIGHTRNAGDDGREGTDDANQRAPKEVTHKGSERQPLRQRSVNLKEKHATNLVESQEQMTKEQRLTAARQRTAAKRLAKHTATTSHDQEEQA